MNISKLILLQKDLDADINKKHPIKKDENRTSDKVTALIVELAEFANEGRWFKFWSNNQQPRTYKEEIDIKNDRFRSYNPLLEEYVDALHFFVSIAIDKGWESELHVTEEFLLNLEETGFKVGLTQAFNVMIYSLLKTQFGTGHTYDKMHYLSDASDFNLAWHMFLGIGLVGFGFTDEEVEAAYMSKNKINHDRQQNNY